MSSLGGLDGISVLALDRGWVELGVIMTSFAILIEAQKGKLRDFTRLNHVLSCGCQLIPRADKQPLLQI